MAPVFAVLVVAVSVGAIAASAFGSSHSDIRKAKLRIAVARSLQPWRPPGSPFKADAKGKVIYYVNINASVPYEETLANGITDGAKAAGASVVTFDCKGQVPEFSRGVDQAISQRANLIVLGGVQPALVAPELADARRAGIPVIAANVGDPGYRPRGTPSAVVATATHSFSYPGKVMADWIIVDSRGKANIVFFSGKGFGPTNDAELGAFQKEITRVCDHCKLQVIDIPITDWQSLTTRTQTVLESDPSTNYLVPLFDGMALFIVPAIDASDAKGRVKVVSFNATPAVLQLLRRGDVIAADVGDATYLEGWGIADQALRILSGQKPVANIRVPERLFDKTNVQGINLKAQESGWYTRASFEKLYETHWGLH